MSKKTSLNNFFLYGIILVLVVLISAKIFSFTKTSVSDKPTDPLSSLAVTNYKEETVYWRNQINKLGTEKAYELFKKDTDGKAYGVSHTLAHVFGELIYEKEGTKGVVYCDATFAFGCYHSFFGAAVSDKGPDVIPELADSCLKRWGQDPACPHGIGHGILGYLGDEKIIDALNICAGLPWKGPFGCESGVFMEYNFHTMQSLDSAEDRAYHADKPYEPCDAIPKKFREICYFAQPQWWTHVLNGDYVQIAKFCKALSDTEEREACFSGVGNIIPPNTSYNVAETIKTCALMEDKRGISLCMIRASWVFNGEPKVKTEAYKVCENMSQLDRIECAKKSEFVPK